MSTTTTSTTATTSMSNQDKTDNANTNNNNNNNNTTSTRTQQHELKAMFHDFLGMKPSAAPITTTTDSASVSIAASSSCGGGVGGRGGPVSTASDIVSERQVGSHLEGIPFYSQRSDICGPEICNRLVGRKRCNSDSAFMGSTRDVIQPIGYDSLENLHLMKMLRNIGGVEQSRRSNDDEVLHGMPPTRPTPASLIMHSSSRNKFGDNVPKWERTMHIGVSAQHGSRAGQFVPFMHQVPTNHFREGNAGPSTISRSAADEGSRTGIKGPGILSSVKTNVEKDPSESLPIVSKPNLKTHNLDPGSSTLRNQRRLTSANRQMTIFYGGQAHVFDDVHPNKADVIMALAGSNGGSWSTTYSPKSATRLQSGENYLNSGEIEPSVAANTTFHRELQARLSIPGTSAQGVGSSGLISTPTGGHQGKNMFAKETRNSVQIEESGVEARGKV